MKFESPEAVVMDAKELFSLPDIYFQLNEMIHDPRFSVADIGSVIAKDPGLSARLLRLVNSSFYGFQSKVDTISRAISIVGLDDLYHLVISTCVVDSFARISSDLVDMTDFWLRSVHCGVVAKLLANECPALNAERLFLVGLLHDIGSLVIYQQMPELAVEVLQAIGHDRRLLDKAEQDLLGFTHAQVGKELLSSWGLPGSLYEVVGFYRQPEMAANYKADVLVLNLASCLVDDRGFGRPIEYTLLDISDQALALLCLNRNQIADIMEQADVEYLQVFERLLPVNHPAQGIVRPN